MILQSEKTALVCITAIDPQQLCLRSSLASSVSVDKNELLRLEVIWATNYTVGLSRLSPPFCIL